MDRDIKLDIVSYMGGECKICGYKRCLKALHCHHINPQDKKFNISERGVFNLLVREELKKCILLCSNCHVEVHAGLIDHELLVDLMEW